MFLINRAFSSYNQNRFAIDKAGQLVLMNLQLVAGILRGVQCPWVKCLIAHVSIKTRILNELYTLTVLKL